jgi:hypothetical protein
MLVLLEMGKLAVWTNIVTEAKKSMMARISLQSLTAYLTTSKI